MERLSELVLMHKLVVLEIERLNAANAGFSVIYGVDS